MIRNPPPRWLVCLIWTTAITGALLLNYFSRGDCQVTDRSGYAP